MSPKLVIQNWSANSAFDFKSQNMLYCLKQFKYFCPKMDAEQLDHLFFHFQNTSSCKKLI